MREIAVAIVMAGAMVAVAIAYASRERVVAFGLNTGTRVIIADTWAGTARTCVLYDAGGTPVQARCEEVSTQ